MMVGRGRKEEDEDGSSLCHFLEVACHINV
jgi:hypothetical protein